MANTKISQLPSWTGTAADLRWFVMNNSGENETYKFSGYTSPFIVENYAQASIFSTFGTPAVYDADCVGSVIIGSEAAGYDDYTTLVGWKAIGNNDIEGRCSAFGADAQATSRETAAFGMSTRATAYQSTALGHLASAEGEKSISVGNRSRATAQRGITIGHDIINFSPYGILIGGVSNTHNSTGYYNNIINGTGNSITGTTSGATMLNCFNRTADTDDTTYVENLRVFGQLNYNPPTIQTGSTITLNMNTGNIQKVVPDTSTLSLTLTNVKNGSSYDIVFQPTSAVSGSLTLTLSAAGFTIKGGTGYNALSIFPNACKMNIIVIDNVMYVNTIKPLT